MGEMASGLAHFSAGDFQSAIESFKTALQASIDPLLIQGSTFFLGYAYLVNGQYQEALSLSQEVMDFSDKYGAEPWGHLHCHLWGMPWWPQGTWTGGWSLVERAEEIYRKTNRRWPMHPCKHFMVNCTFRSLRAGDPRVSPSWSKNIRSLVKLVPGAARKAEEHFNKAIEVAGEIGAKGVLAQAHLGLGLLHKAKGETRRPGKAFPGPLKSSRKSRRMGS